MAAGTDATHLVAIVSPGAHRLPVLPEKDARADLADLVALAGDTGAHIAAPGPA